MKGLSRGFTLFEIMMVVTVIGLFAVVAIPQFIDFSNDIKVSLTKEKLVIFKRAIAGDARHFSGGQFLSLGFELNLGALPSSLDDLVTQGAYSNYNPYTKKGWRGPYLSNLEPDWDKDAWGNAIIYNSGGRTLTSFGPDELGPNSDDIVVAF